VELSRSGALDPREAHVLVVEDNVSNFVLAARLLAYAGVKHCEWKTTGWGVAEFAENLPQLDLVLVDLRLPHEDGYRVLAALRAHPRFTSMPIIAVTAQSDRDEMERARRAGFTGFLPKPLDPDLFPGQLIRILQGEELWGD
jgi:two-component system cell cycle response regulator DivK